MSATVATRPAIARPYVHVYVLRSGADLKAMLGRSGGRGNRRSAVLARAMHSFSEKVLADLDAGRLRPCGVCAEPRLTEGCDMAAALVVSPTGTLATIALSLCRDCSPDTGTATRNTIAAMQPLLPAGATIKTPGKRP